MPHHHKTNAEVEGNPDSGHGRGLPKRPDETELDERTDLDRIEAGLPAEEDEPPDADQAADEDPEGEHER